MSDPMGAHEYGQRSTGDYRVHGAHMVRNRRSMNRHGTTSSSCLVRRYVGVVVASSVCSHTALPGLLRTRWAQPTVDRAPAALGLDRAGHRARGQLLQADHGQPVAAAGNAAASPARPDTTGARAERGRREGSRWWAWLLDAKAVTPPVRRFVGDLQGRWPRVRYAPPGISHREDPTVGPSAPPIGSLRQRRSPRTSASTPRHF
jgi:hypothetical protein